MSDTTPTITAAPDVLPPDLIADPAAIVAPFRVATAAAFNAALNAKVPSILVIADIPDWGGWNTTYGPHIDLGGKTITVKGTAFSVRAPGLQVSNGTITAWTAFNVHGQGLVVQDVLLLNCGFGIVLGTANGVILQGVKSRGTQAQTIFLSGTAATATSPAIPSRNVHINDCDFEGSDKESVFRCDTLGCNDLYITNTIIRQSTGNGKGACRINAGNNINLADCQIAGELTINTDGGGWGGVDNLLSNVSVARCQLLDRGPGSLPSVLRLYGSLANVAISDVDIHVQGHAIATQMAGKVNKFSNVTLTRVHRLPVQAGDLFFNQPNPGLTCVDVK